MSSHRATALLAAAAAAPRNNYGSAPATTPEKRPDSTSISPLSAVGAPPGPAPSPSALSSPASPASPGPSRAAAAAVPYSPSAAPVSSPAPLVVSSGSAKVDINGDGSALAALESKVTFAPGTVLASPSVASHSPARLDQSGSSEDPDASFLVDNEKAPLSCGARFVKGLRDWGTGPLVDFAVSYGLTSLVSTATGGFGLPAASVARAAIESAGPYVVDAFVLPLVKKYFKNPREFILKYDVEVSNDNYEGDAKNDFGSNRDTLKVFSPYFDQVSVERAEYKGAGAAISAGAGALMALGMNAPAAVRGLVGYAVGKIPTTICFWKTKDKKIDNLLNLQVNLEGQFPLKIKKPS